MRMQDIARNALSELTAVLNTKLNGNYVFAGSNIDAPPVGDIANNSNIIAGQPSTNYYKGNGIKDSISVTGDVSVSYGITADADGFRDLIGALHQAISGDISDNSADLESAMETAEKAVSGIIELRTLLGIQMETIEAIGEQNKAVKSFLEKEISLAKEADIPQVTMFLNQNITMLQASYMAFSALSGLSLAKVLNF
jgi:flagellar hook-associated protein 3 FlgL